MGAQDHRCAIQININRGGLIDYYLLADRAGLDEVLGGHSIDPVFGVDLLAGLLGDGPRRGGGTESKGLLRTVDHLNWHGAVNVYTEIVLVDDGVGRWLYNITLG